MYSVLFARWLTRGFILRDPADIELAGIGNRCVHRVTHSVRDRERDDQAVLEGIKLMAV